jgi:hypothetical protein
MLIDCDTCAVRGPACGDCVVTILIGAPPAGAAGTTVDVDDAERAAMAVLAESGLVPPLRLVVPGAGEAGASPPRRRHRPIRDHDAGAQGAVG